MSTNNMICNPKPPNYHRYESCNGAPQESVNVPQQVKEWAKTKDCDVIPRKSDREKSDDATSEKNMVHNRLVRGTLILAGTLFLGLGIIGIFIPILPTTPFLLLAAACYARSSKRFYSWLLNNKWFGDYVKNYREGKGVPLKVKILSISFLWITVMFSAFFVVTILFVRIILILIAIAVTIHILTIRTLKR